jgi:hypothetical protein
VKLALAIAALVWLPQQQPAAQDAPVQAAPPVTARLTCEPATAELGEPLRWTLRVEHPAGASARLEEDPSTPPAGDTAAWLVLAAGEPLTLPDPRDATRAITTWHWSACALEPGQRGLPALAAVVDGGDGWMRAAAEPPQVEIRPALAEGEDAARPALGFREVEIAPQARVLWPWITGCVTLLAAAILAAVSIHRARRAQPKAEPSAAVQLAGLAARSFETPQDVQEAHYQLSHIVREALDRRAAQARRGLTDEEWVALASSELEPAARAQLQQLFAACAEVKYGARRPTHWAAGETIAKARELVDGLDAETAGASDPARRSPAA